MTAHNYRVVLPVVLVLSLTTGAGCEKSSNWRNNVFTEQDMSRSSVQARLPSSLWDEIVSVLHGKNTGEAATPKKDSVRSVFSSLKVFLIEKNRGILHNGNVEVQYGPGGGELDLRDFVQSKNGSFYFAVDFLPDLEKVERKVFYLSDARLRKIGADSFGAGCDTYFDISSAFAKAMRGEGFLVNTTDARHVSALAGVYFFAAAHEGKLYLASLTVKDSSVSRKLLCGSY